MNTKRTNSAVRLVKANAGILMVLLILTVVLSFLTPNFLKGSNIISVMRQISNNVYLALGMTLIIILGGIDLSVGAIVALTGTLTVGFIVNFHMPMVLAIVIGIGLGVLIGFLNGCIVARFNVPAFIVTLATMNISRGIAYVFSGGRSTRITSEAFENIGTATLFGFLPIPVLYMIILIDVFVFLLSKTKFGPYVYAFGANMEAARLSGLPIKKVIIAVFTISGTLAAFAGLVLASRMYSGQPSAGDGYEMDAIAACVLGGVSMSGGVGTIGGTIIGAIVIGIISNGLNLMGVSSFWQLIVKGIIILVAVIIDSQKKAINQKIGEMKKKNKANNG